MGLGGRWGRKLDTERGQMGINTDLGRAVGHKGAVGTRIWVVALLTESEGKDVEGEMPGYKDCVFSGRPSTWQGHEG